MCLRRGATVVLLLLFAAVAVSVGGIARAACIGDKDVLADGSCGYFVQPAGPDPAITPTPTPVPTVHVDNFPNTQDVTISNWPAADPSSGWTAQDRALLLSVGEYVRAGLVILVFLIGAGLVVLLPFPRKGA